MITKVLCTFTADEITTALTNLAREKEKLNLGGSTIEYHMVEDENGLSFNGATVTFNGKSNPAI